MQTYRDQTQYHGPKRIILPNHNPALVILSVSVDELDVAHFDTTPVVGWDAELIDGRWVADRPITVQDLERDPWAIHDLTTGLCYSPAGVYWIGGMDPQEAKTVLADSARRLQST
ncbi:MAG: hypothetical protein KAX46_12825 [Chromatiaceae bacterium]|nr:hypothetical protein [Chromatiaceae bacterium]